MPTEPVRLIIKSMNSDACGSGMVESERIRRGKYVRDGAPLQAFEVDEIIRQPTATDKRSIHCRRENDEDEQTSSGEPVHEIAGSLGSAPNVNARP